MLLKKKNYCIMGTLKSRQANCQARGLLGLGSNWPKMWGKVSKPPFLAAPLTWSPPFCSDAAMGSPASPPNPSLAGCSQPWICSAALPEPSDSLGSPLQPAQLLGLHHCQGCDLLQPLLQAGKSPGILPLGSTALGASPTMPDHIHAG